MEVREAILAAADHIERNPQEFNFTFTAVPRPGCGTPGCALGWIAFHLDLDCIGDASTHIGCEKGSVEFYMRMIALGGHEWTRSAAACAPLMRAYADKYHPATSDTKSERHTTPPTNTAPKYDFEALAGRLAREPRAEHPEHAA